MEGIGVRTLALRLQQGFLRCVEALRMRAGEIGEADEEQRCALFLRQLDPDWDRRDQV